MTEPTVDRDQVDLLRWAANQACERIFRGETDGTVCPKLSQAVQIRIQSAAALVAEGEMTPGDAALRMYREERRLVDAPPLRDPHPELRPGALVPLERWD